MSVVTVAVIVGFVCCVLLIRALENGQQRRSWETNAAPERVRVSDDRSWRAMMDE
jgi:hypothetical protein